MSLIGIIRSGDSIGFLKKVESLVQDFFTHDVEPALEAFIKQFTTDFGKKALELAAPIAAEVIAGTMTIGDAASKIIHDLGVLGVTTAEQDAKDVALNAIRVHLTSISAA